MRYKNFIKPILFIMGLFLILILSSAFTSRYGFLQGPYGKMTGLLKAPDDSFDYLVIGDSESRTSISPMIIWKDYGYSGFNCGIPGQRLQDTYYWLEKSLKNQSPKVIMLETNAFYRKITYMKEMETTVELKMQTMFSIFQYHNDWLHINPHDLKNNRAVKAYESTLIAGAGYRNSKTVKPYKKGDYIHETEEKEEIQERPLYYLNKIVELCKKKDIQLILYSSPSPICWTYKKYNAAAAFAEKNNLQYIDLNIRISDVGIDWSKDTRDKGNHINYYGSQKVTKFIGQYLYNHTKMTDHRKDEKYQSWNDALGKYMKQAEKKQSAKSIADDYL